jgi:hypothetical protein
MKKSATTLLILICSLPLLHAQKVRYGQGLPKARPGVDYPLTLHISAMRLRPACPVYYAHFACPADYADVVYVEAVVNGKKIELSSGFDQYMEFPRDIKAPLLGDYQARIISKNPGADLSTIGLRYELLLHDRSVLSCTVTGVSE